MSYIIMRRGPDPGKIYHLDADTISVGRGSKNQIIIHDNEVSRNHMQFVKTPTGYELHDLNSSNGTFVNGQPVEASWPIQTQCIIELGDSITFEYRMGQPEDDPDVSEIYKSRSPTPVKEKSFLILTVEGRDEPEVYPLEGMSITVGRSTANDIVVVEPELSREHFRLTLMPQGYFAEDLGSTNGTFVNGEPLAGQRLLYTNDVIQIGTTIRLALSNSPEGYIDRSVTSSLGVDGPKSDKRKTSQLPSLAPSLEPTGTGTGVEHRSLEDEVLITYAREDWEKIVAPMVGKLYEADISSWVDQYLVERSNDWILATEQARLECWLLIVVVSPDAMNSDLVKRNWRHFQNREKPIILVIHQPVDRMPIGASRLPAIQYNPAVPDIAFQQLISEIKRIKDPQPELPPPQSAETKTETSEQLQSASPSNEKSTVSSPAIPSEESAVESPESKPKNEKRPAKPLMAALEAAKQARAEEDEKPTDDQPLAEAGSTDAAEDSSSSTATSDKPEVNIPDDQPLAEVGGTDAPKDSASSAATSDKPEAEAPSDSASATPEDKAAPVEKKPLATKADTKKSADLSGSAQD